jgi:hypothetical protein
MKDVAVLADGTIWVDRKLLTELIEWLTDFLQNLPDCEITDDERAEVATAIGELTRIRGMYLIDGGKSA